MGKETHRTFGKEERLTGLSKFLSLLLRHKPEKANIKLDKKGWAKVSELTDPSKGNFVMEDLEEIVRTDSKGRYEFNGDRTMLRAVQGHSIQDLEVEVEKAIPPGILYHGTKETVMMEIAKKGLMPMNRKFVHLSDNIKTAQEVADRRSGKSIIMEIDCVQMVAKDHKFFKAANGVWLSPGIPPEFIRVK